MIGSVRRFAGVWVLDPTRTEYGDQAAPARGVYSIRLTDDAAVFHVHWTDAGDTGTRSMEFRAALDGTTTPLSDGLQLSLCTRGDALVTTVERGGETVHEAVRTLATAGGVESMTVLQRLTEDSGTVNLSSRYVRAGVKQVIVYRRDLKMRKGKIAAQVAHASLRVFFAMDEGDDDRMVIPLAGPVHTWARGRFAKVVLSVENEDDLLTIHRLARERGVPTSLITDAGKTEFGGVPTRTTVAVGPWASPEIDEITGPHGAVATKLA